MCQPLSVQHPADTGQEVQFMFTSKIHMMKTRELSDFHSEAIVVLF